MVDNQNCKTEISKKLLCNQIVIKITNFVVFQGGGFNLEDQKWRIQNGERKMADSKWRI